MDLKHFDGLWRMLRSSEEKRRDRQLEEHEDLICSEDCPLCAIERDENGQS